MNDLSQKLQREAERIAARHPHPEFYVRFKAPSALARKIYYHHPLPTALRESVQPYLQEDLGHGLFHSMRVSIDSATLICVELESNPLGQAQLERLMMLGVCAGLLHDICRGQERHAAAGAQKAAILLRDFPLTAEEVEAICQAIHNHEAFVRPTPCPRPFAQLISDCLYDADKFRWGRDTFTHTLWHMMSQQGVDLPELIKKFPWGMSGILRIRDTFRTTAGRQFGPQIIETGMEIGKEIYHYLRQQFGENHDCC